MSTQDVAPQPKQAAGTDDIDLRQADVGFENDMKAISLAEEHMRGGWTRFSTGAPGLPPPAPLQGGCGGGEQGYEDASTDES